MATKSINSAELENLSEQSGELFPEIAKKPSAASSSGIRQTDLIMQQGQKWYKNNVEIHDAARDTLTDEESLQNEFNVAFEEALNEEQKNDEQKNEDQGIDNPQYLKSIFEQINNLLIPALEYFNDASLTHLQKARQAKKTQGEILQYLKQFYAHEYRKYVSTDTLEQCQFVIAPPD